jgi:YVTN family beta-propeller protein
LQVIGSAPTGKKPDGIVYDPASKRVFAVNGGSNSATPIDAVSGKALAAISLGGKPEFVAVDGKGRLFVNLEDKNQLVVVDTQKLAVTQRYDLAASCDEPAGLSIDAVAQRLFVGCHNQKMAIVDANTGKILDTAAIGRGSDATAFDEGAKLAFSSNGDGTLNVIAARDATHYQLKQTVSTMPRARTMAIDPVSHKIYLVAAEAEPAGAGAGQAPPRRPNLKAGTFTLITVAP